MARKSAKNREQTANGIAGNERNPAGWLIPTGFSFGWVAATSVARRQCQKIRSTGKMIVGGAEMTIGTACSSAIPKKAMRWAWVAMNSM
jgi:hypothetical protein